MKLKSIFLIAAGVLLVIWASTQAVNQVLPAFQATTTPDETILESYAPNSGPLSGVQTGMDVESQPVGPTQAPTAGSQASAHLATAQIPGKAPALTQSASAVPLPGSVPLATDSAMVEAATLPALPTEDTSSSEGPFLAPIEPTPTPAPTQVEPVIPDRIIIPAIGLDAPVTLAASQKVMIGGEAVYQWLAPDMFAAGWHTNSAYLGQPGNTVLDGHHNIFGKVFGGLVNLVPGDKIDVYSQGRAWHWVVTNTMILPERDQPLSVRLENARWISHSDDTRLTLITCWPADNNTHRMIIVAVPDPAGFGG